MNTLMQGQWTILILRGILALILGILMILNLQAGVLAVLVILGVYAIADGVLKLGEAYAQNKAQKSYRNTLLSALASIVIGILIFAWPKITAVILIALIITQVLFQGGSDVYAAFHERKYISRGRFWLRLIAGSAQLLFGLWMIAQPAIGGLTIIAVIAAYALVVGTILIIRGIEEKMGGPGPGPMAIA